MINEYSIKIHELTKKNKMIYEQNPNASTLSQRLNRLEEMNIAA